MPTNFELTSWALLAAEAVKKEPGGISSFLFGPFAPFLLIAFLFYFLMIRPERRKRAALVEMLGALKKADRVVTIGGIYGTVVSVQKDEVTIRVDEGSNTKLKMQRSAIARVLSDDSGMSKGDM